MAISKGKGAKVGEDRKKAPRKKRASRKAVKASTKKAPVATVAENPNEPLPPKSVRGKILWEYRALYAEWKVAYAEGRLTAEKYKQEVSTPDGQVKSKYKELLDLIVLERSCREEVKRRGAALSDIQQRIADKLGIDLELFVKHYSVDIGTGAVTYIGIE